MDGILSPTLHYFILTIHKEYTKTVAPGRAIAAE